MNSTHPVAIIRFDRSSAIAESSRPAADRLVEGQPEHSVRNIFTDSGGHFFCGLWSSTPGSWRVSYTENEFCHLLRGRVSITDGDGHSEEFGPGDSFVIPAGFVGTWRVIEAAQKLYAIYEA
jgi:uncharacterized cupin superfamily protein